MIVPVVGKSQSLLCWNVALEYSVEDGLELSFEFNVEAVEPLPGLVRLSRIAENGVKEAAWDDRGANQIARTTKAAW